MRHDLGSGLENRLARIELAAETRPLGALGLGVALALMTIIGGLVAFIAVFVILVGVFH